MNDMNDRHRHRREPNGNLWLDWSRGRIFGLALLLTAGNFFFQILFYVAGGGLYLPVLAGSVLGVFLPLYLLARNFGFEARRDFSLNLPRPGVLVASALLAIAALVPTSMLAELSLRLHPVDSQWLRLFEENLPRSGGAIALAVVAVVVVAPLAEETIFRGLLHRLAASLWGGLPAALVSALVFAVVHGEPWFLFGLVGIGLVLAFVYEATGSLTACWVTHAVHNGVSLGLMLTSDEIVPEPTPLTTGDWVWCAASVVALLVIGRYLKDYGWSRPT